MSTDASDQANLSFVATTGSLPAGVGFSTYAFGSVSPETRHAIAGTPTTAGSETFEVTVTDSLGTGAPGDDVTATAEITIDVVADNTGADAVIAAGRDPRGYTIDCDSQAREVQGTLRDLSNFGATGTVDQRLAIKDMVATIDAAYLADVDVLADGWVDDAPTVGSFAPAEIDAIETWVEAGGVLIATEDRNVADALGERFGAPVLGNILCNHTPSEPGDPTTDCPTFSAASATHPVVNGPFGDWSTGALNTSGSVGQFGAAPTGWTVIATDAQGNATVISRRVEAGRVILLSDEGLMRTESYDGSNATFVANLFAYALDPFAVPELVDDTVAGTTGEALSFDLCANDTSTGDPVIDVTITDGDLPIGLALDDCTVTGSPTTPGDSVATYQVEDGDGDVDTAMISFSIAQGADLPTCRGETATIVGTSGPDTLRGTDGRDVIVGLGGPDTLIGLGGNDIICGGAGNDTIRGNLGNDQMIGQRGDDTIVGGRGDDLGIGGAGDDLVRGKRGSDDLRGNGDDDRLTGNRGDDVARGGAGTDIVRGNGGDDRLAGNSGDNDRCVGGRGADTFLRGCEIERGGVEPS